MFRRHDPDALFARYRLRGDGRALARLVDRTAPELLRLASYLAADRHAAEDLVQETFLTVLECAGRFDAKRSVVPWMLGILANHARHRRRQSLRSEPSESMPEWLEASRDSTIEEHDFVNVLRGHIAEVEPPYRDILRLHLIHGLTAKEIAEVLERSPGTVRTQIVRGLKRLRNILPAGFAVGASWVSQSGVPWGSSPSNGVIATLRETVVRAAVVHPISVATPVASSLLGGSALSMKVSTAALLAAVGLVALLSLSRLTTRAESADATERSMAGRTIADSPPSSNDLTDVAADATRTNLAAGKDDPLVLSNGATVIVVRVQRGRHAHPASGAVLVARPHVLDSEMRLRESTADADGVASFVGVTPGTWTISAARGGAVEAIAVSGSTTEVDLVIPPGLPVDGVVVDHVGVPVPRARVWMSDGRRRSEAGRIVTVADSGGRFHIDDVTPGRYVSAFANGLKPARLVRVDDRATAAEVRLVMTGVGRALIGHVVGDAGEVVRGAVAQVGWSESEMRSLVDTGGLPTRVARSDERGIFRADGVDDRYGRVPVWVRAAGYAVAVLDVDLSVAGDVHVNVQLERGASVYGVVSNERGVPGANIHISALQEEVRPDDGHAYLGPDWARRSTYSSESGKFEVPNVHSGAVRMKAEKGDSFASAALNVDDRTTYEWSPRLTTGMEIRGVVVAESGGVLAGWDVWAVPADTGREPSRETTGHDGSFVLSGCDAVEYELHTRTPNLNQSAAHMSGVLPGAAPITFIVPADAVSSCFVTGRVIGADGETVAELTVYLSLAQEGPFSNGTSGQRSGNFRIGPVPPGRYQVQVAEKGASSFVDLGEYDLVNGEVTDIGEHALGAMGWIQLEAIDETGKRLPEGSFTTMQDGGMNGSIIELRQGVGLSAPLPPGVYRIQSFGGNVAASSIVAEVFARETTEVRFEIERGVQRTLRFPPVSVRMSGFTLECFDAAGKIVTSTTSFLENIEEPMDLPVRLVPGRYRWVTTLARGGKAECTVVVDGADRPDEVIEIPTPDEW